ncbi:hypothetical protein ES705_20285 [subsurface metagenome]
MSKHLVILRCSRTTASVTIAASICLFLLIGCASLFRSAGLSDDQAAEQTAELKAALTDATQEAIATVQTGLAEGHDLKTIAAKASSAFIWKIIAAAGATAGVVLNGLLAKWLGTEKKITKAIITGVENSNDQSAKQSIRSAAIAAGVESKLSARVKALT